MVGWGVTYEEETESIADTFECKFILLEFVFIDVEHLGGVHVREQEHGEEEGKDNHKALELKEASSQSDQKSGSLAEPEYEVKSFALNNRNKLVDAFNSSQ